MSLEQVSHYTVMKQLVAPRFGFIQGVYEVELEGDDPAVFNAFARSANPGFFGDMFAPGNMENGGAGLTRQAAITATIGECVERYAMASRPHEKRLLRLTDFLKRGLPPPIEPDGIALFSTEQYNDPSFPFSPFTDSSLLSWTPVTALDSGADLSYPSSLIYIPYYPVQGEDILAPAISTGAVCGTSTAMVRAKGISECIERDSIMLYWMTGMSPETLNPCRLPLFKNTFRRFFDRPWLEYRLFILFNDFEVPVAFCILRDHSSLEMQIVVGGAASLNLEDAVGKAFTEAVQGRYWVKYMLKTGQLESTFDDPTRIEVFADHVRYYAQKDPWTKMVPFHHCEEISSTRLAKLLSNKPTSWQEEFETLLDRVIARGYQVLYKDITTVDIAGAGLVVGKVITPTFINLNASYRARFEGSNRFETVPPLLQRTPLYSRSRGFNPKPHPYP